MQWRPEADRSMAPSDSNGRSVRTEGLPRFTSAPSLLFHCRGGAGNDDKTVSSLVIPGHSLNRYVTPGKVM